MITKYINMTKPMRRAMRKARANLYRDWMRALRRLEAIGMASGWQDADGDTVGLFKVPSVQRESLLRALKSFVACGLMARMTDDDEECWVVSDGDGNRLVMSFGVMSALGKMSKSLSESVN